MKIKEGKENAKIKQAYANAVPDICDVILSDCENEKGKIIIVPETKKKESTVKYLMAAAGFLLVLGVGALLFNTYHINYMVASTVSLEVNPSIQILVNEKEKVLDVKALNKDGGIVVGDMDFSGSDIDVTINALIGAMLRKGYLNELANSILISVDNSDPAKGAVLQKRLTEEVNELLESDGFFGAVLGQTLNNDNNLQQQADLYGITLGKAQLIQQILDSTVGHTFEDLAPLSINELNLLIASRTVEIGQVSSMGNASDKAYIGEDKAKEIAYAHAKVTAEDVVFCKMDMDVEKGVMVYEIEFKCGGYEYEYDINAQTGDIIANKKEIDDDMTTGTTTPGAGTASPSTGGSASTEGTASSSGETAASESGTASSFGNAAGTEDTIPAEGTVPPSDGTGTSHHTEHHYEETHHNAYPPAQSGSTGAGAGLITVDMAKATALNHAGLTADVVYFEKAKLDYDDGKQIYEIEFVCGNMEYEYEIDAVSGVVWDYDWDYDD